MSTKSRVFWSIGCCAVLAGTGGWVFAQRDDDAPRNGKSTKAVSSNKAGAVKKNVAAESTTGKETSTKKTPHTPQGELVVRVLERLHMDALRHFYADPRFGMSRLPAVYEKVKRKWELPYFSPSELEDQKPLTFHKDLDRIHTGTIKDFVVRKPANAKSRRFPIFPFRRKGTKFDPKKIVWEAKTVDMIGLLKHKHPVAYVAADPHKKDGKSANRKPTKRELDDFEYAALKKLDAGKDLYARAHKGVVRMVGSIRAKKSCLACHEGKKEGDLFGAFSYTLREARYERRIRGRRYPLRGIGQRRSNRSAKPTGKNK